MPLTTLNIVGVFDTSTQKLKGIATPDGTGYTDVGAGGSSVTVRAFTTRAIVEADNSANNVLSGNATATVNTGLGAGFNTQFSNGTASSVVLTVTPGSGVTLNGATSTVARTLGVGQTTSLIPVGANAYILPGA